MAPISRIAWPDRPLAQLIGSNGAPKSLLSLNGNGHAPAESKASFTNLSYLPPELFWRSDGSSITDIPGVQRELRGFNAFAVSALAYACMQYRADKLTEPPLWIVEETKDGEEWLPSDTAHPLSALLEQPNPDMDMSELMFALSLYLDVTGRALLLKVKDNAGRVAQLWPYHGDEFTVEKANGRLYGRFRIATGSGQKVFAPEDVIFFKNPDPRSPLDGIAPLDAALAHVNIGDQMRRAIQSLLRKQIKPGAIGYFPEGLTPDERSNLEAQMNALYAGVANLGKFMAVEGTDKPFQFLDANLKNLAFGDVQSDVEATVCSVFAVHPVLIHTKLGITANSGLADTIKPAQSLFYDRYAFPAWARVEKVLTKALLRVADPNKLRFIRFDKGKVRALQQDDADKVNTAKAAAGIWTLNEQRVHTGKEALADERGDEIRVAAAPAPAPNVDAQDPPAKSAARPSASKSGNAPKDLPRESKRDARRRLWRKFDVKARREEAAYEAAALAQFEKEKREVAAKFEGSTDATIQAALSKLQSAYTLKDGQYHLEWLKRYEDLISKTFNVAGDDLAAEVGFDFNLENPQVQRAISRRVNKLAKNVTDTTYDKIREAVSEGRRNGEGTGLIADRIRNDVFGGDITKARATTIARTETVGALNEGEAVAARESGVIRSKEWLSQGDDRVRGSDPKDEFDHRIDGEKVALDQPFSIGLMYPGDQTGDPGNVINCRCTVLYSDEEP